MAYVELVDRPDVEEDEFEEVEEQA
jgi:hypothetical protein